MEATPSAPTLLEQLLRHGRHLQQHPQDALLPLPPPQLASPPIFLSLDPHPHHPLPAALLLPPPPLPSPQPQQPPPCTYPAALQQLAAALRACEELQSQG